MLLFMCGRRAGSEGDERCADGSGRNVWSCGGVENINCDSSSRGISGEGVLFTIRSATGAVATGTICEDGTALTLLFACRGMSRLRLTFLVDSALGLLRAEFCCGRCRGCDADEDDDATWPVFCDGTCRLASAGGWAILILGLEGRKISLGSAGCAGREKLAITAELSSSNNTVDGGATSCFKGANRAFFGGGGGPMERGFSGKSMLLRLILAGKSFVPTASFGGLARLWSSKGSMVCLCLLPSREPGTGVMVDFWGGCPVALFSSSDKSPLGS